MSTKKYTNDLVIIGGGAAGMFAAITAAQQGLSVLLLEKNDRLGKKLAITGKGRCNVTNACSAEEVLKNIPRNGRFLFSSLFRFPPERIMTFFEEAGCPLKVERGNRVFPVSDRSADIISALQRKLQQLRVQVRHTKVTGLLIREGEIQGVKTEQGIISIKY